MTIDLAQRLSVTLTRTSLIVVILLGLLIAVLQVYFEYIDQQKSVDKHTQEIIAASSIPAQRAVHNLDNDLAQEVVRGLKQYDFLHHIAIYDDRGQIMAIYDEPVPSSETSWLTHILLGQSSTFEHPLSDETQSYQGRLVIKLSNDRAMHPLYKKSVYLFLSGLARNVLLAIILAYVYHQLLTRPLFDIAKHFSLLNQERGKIARIPQIKHHEHNELGRIINSANHLLSDLEQREEDYARSENQLRIILNASPNLVFALNEKGNFVFLNSATANFYQKIVSGLENKNFFELHKKIDESEAYKFLKSVKASQENLMSPYNCEHVLTDSEGNQHIVHASFIPYTLYEQRCILVVSSDITARVEAENRVEKLAYFDTLTQLPNKQQIQECLHEDIRRSKAQQKYGALLLIDIDNFKRINDTLGHSTGDALLLKLSSRMQTKIGKEETLARLGGDEFIVSMPTLSQNMDETKDQVVTLADDLLKVIRQPIHLGNHEFEVSASIGIALYSDSEHDLDKLLSAADTAMYQAKSQGQDRYVLFETKMSDEASRLVKLESDIRKAIAEDQFTFFLQPLIDSQSREMVAAEALLRWQHPEHGIILPADFMDYLEQSPMMSKVGEAILEKVCAFIYSCRNRGLMTAQTRIAVNVSAREFYQAHFTELVAACLQKYHLHGSCLILEITEGAALMHIDQAIAKIHELKELGVHFALDDFGTGYSSLSYLKQLPIDKIKIDKSFIEDITIDKQDATLVASIMAIAHTLNLDVVAEGVETEEQATWLASQGQLQFQGFLFDRAIPAAEFEYRYLDENPTLTLPMQ